jgi:hypothetical protein
MVHTNCHEEREGETGDKVIQAQNKGIPQNYQEIRRTEETLKLIKTYPLAFPNP